MSAKYRHGNPLMIDYTPGSSVTAGDVVQVGGLCLVAHSDIPASTLGALACPSGSAVYEITKATISDVFAVGALVEIDVSEQAAVVANNANGNITFGRCVKASANGDATVWAVHIPSMDDPTEAGF